MFSSSLESETTHSSAVALACVVGVQVGWVGDLVTTKGIASLEFTRG